MRRFFEEHKLDNDNSLSEDRVKKIKRSVLSRVEEVKPMKKQFKFKPLVIAAAVVAACSAMAITAGALLKAPTKFTVNDMEVEPYYNEYKDELGNDIVMYVIDVPDFALGKAVEGNTAVGDIRVVPNPEYPSKWGEYMIVDELGNEFHVGINDKIVMYELNGKDGIGTFDCSNFLKDEYEYVQIISGEDEAHTYNMLQEFYFVPRGQAGEILKDRGYYAD